jgi:DNA helicase-2/ATP-dependent DNA helicase PcrA
LVLAGAGTGKTRVLTTRIAHMLAPAAPQRDPRGHLHQQGRARDEAAHRRLIGAAVEGMPWLGTFHAIGVKLLRRHAELVGLKSNFTILDTDDQIRLMKQLIQAENIDEKRWPARSLPPISTAGRTAADPTRCRRRCAPCQRQGRELYAAYQERLKTF